MPLLKEETYIIDDIYALPEGERAELIDGHLYMMAPSSRKHQKISMELSTREIPNSETISAINEVQQMKKNPFLRKSYTDIDKMMRDLTI